MKESKKLRKISGTWYNNRRYEEFEACICDLLHSSAVHSMEQYIQHSDLTCLEHSLNVSFNSYRFCRFLGLDYREAARGALLHDFFLYDWHTTKTDTLHAFSHPHTALKNAQGLFTLTAKEKDIIVKHMWPLTVILPRYRESLVVSLVDKYCAVTETIAFRKKVRQAYLNLLRKYRLKMVNT